MRRPTAIRMLLIGLLSVSLSGAGSAQTSQGTVNASLVNISGIAIVFYSDPAGATLVGASTAAASLSMGTISAYGPLGGGVTRSNAAGSFTVSTPFDVQVVGGLLSNSFNLTAQLASAAPKGFTYILDAFTLTGAPQLVTTGGTYSSTVKHNLSLVVLTASPTGSGPAVNTPLTSTIQFVATAN